MTSYLHGVNNIRLSLCRLFNLFILMFKEPSDPTSYLVADHNVTKALEFLKKKNAEQSEVHLTMTHLFGHAIAWGLYKIRRDVGRLPWGYFRHAKEIGVTCLVDVEGGKDLVPVTIMDAHKMTLIEFAKACSEKVQRAKNKKDKAHNESTKLFNYIPSFVAQPLMHTLTYLSGCCGLDFPALGLKSTTFGHAVLTNIGMLGYDQGFAPIAPPMRCMGLFCTGKITKKPVVMENDEIKIQSMMNVVSTGDHRFGDASIFTKMNKTMMGYVADPANFDPTLYPESPHYSELVAEKKSN